MGNFSKQRVILINRESYLFFFFFSEKKRQKKQAIGLMGIANITQSLIPLGTPFESNPGLQSPKSFSSNSHGVSYAR